MYINVYNFQIIIALYISILLSLENAERNNTKSSRKCFKKMQKKSFDKKRKIRWVVLLCEKINLCCYRTHVLNVIKNTALE